MHAALQLVFQMAETSPGRQQLSETFGVCSGLQAGQGLDLAYWIQAGAADLLACATLCSLHCAQPQWGVGRHAQGTVIVRHSLQPWQGQTAPVTLDPL